MAWAPMKSGRMRCPKHGEVDVEQCFNCVAFRDLRGRRGRVELRCSANGRTPRATDEVRFASLRGHPRGV